MFDKGPDSERFSSYHVKKNKYFNGLMFKSRRILILFFFSLSVLFLLAKLSTFQFSGYKKFTDLAIGQQNRVFRIESWRGTIYDRFMEPLAINLDAKSIFSDPRFLEDKESAASFLSDVLEIKKDILLDKFNRENAFVWIKRKVTDEQAQAVENMKIPGIYFVTESKRSYFNENMASHVIGFVNVDNKGLEGLEKVYEDNLGGTPGWRHIVRDAKRRTVLIKEKESVPAKNGSNIVLTVDSVIQYIVEEELDRMVKKFNPGKASVVVMDPFTGQILALANFPNYNLNEFNKTPKEFFKNTSISDVYEPGSVFKIVTASAALDEGVVALEDKFFCENGEYRVGGRILHDFHRYGRLSFQDIIVKSSNIGTVKIAEKLGKKRVFEAVKKFGFGSKTGIELPGEVAGISRHYSKWSKSDITTIPIGQGIAVTPLQLASAVSVIANGGFLMKPYVVEKITTWQGDVYKEFSPECKGRVLKKETCDKMKEVLYRVVSEGTGKRANSKKYKVCGKTGTAQKVNPSGGYYENKYNATFIGFAPKERPVLSIVVTASDPHPVYFGGSVAGPTFKNIAERTLEYLKTVHK